jgi:TetR/AcrR family transcriptional repressor of nem operon
MARPKEFDPDAALERAMDLFHRQGYEATSMQELVDELGVGRGSLYETFGSKQQLFNACLARYGTGLTDYLAQLSDADKPLDAIRAIIRGTGEHQCAVNKGCLMVNSTVELAPHDEVVQAAVGRAWGKVEAAFRAALERAQADGDLSADKNPRAIARFLVTTMHGMSVAGKYRDSKAQFKDIADVALSVLE